ncbi:unnamed protein product [Arabidopsis halleri]
MPLWGFGSVQTSGFPLALFPPVSTTGPHLARALSIRLLCCLKLVLGFSSPPVLGGSRCEC